MNPSDRRARLRVWLAGDGPWWVFALTVAVVIAVLAIAFGYHLANTALKPSY